MRSPPGHANLGATYLARGQWPAALASYREAIRLSRARTPLLTVVKSIVEEEIRRHRDTFVGLCRAAWQSAGRAGHLEDRAGRRDLHGRAAGLAHLGRLGARQDDGAARGGDTELGRRIRRCRTLSDRVLALHAEDQKLLADWSEVQTRRPTYSALLDEFRAASIARGRDRRRRSSGRRNWSRACRLCSQRCPPGQASPAARAANRERETIGKQLGRAVQGRRRPARAMMSAAAWRPRRRRCPAMQDFTARRTALRDEIDRSNSEVRPTRARNHRSFPGIRCAHRPQAAVGGRGSGAAEGRRGDGRHPGRLGAELRVGRNARARRAGPRSTPATRSWPRTCAVLATASTSGPAGRRGRPGSRAGA